MDAQPLGPYFDVERHPAGALAEAPWRSMSELLDDPAVLAGRVQQLREAIGSAGQRPLDEISERVAASVMQLGLVARLVSPVLAEAALNGRIAPVRLAELWWQPEPGGSFPLSVPPPADADTSDAEELGALLGLRLVDATIGDLNTAIGARFRVPDRVLWGNVASALNAAVFMLGRARPEAEAAAGSIAAAMRARPKLAGEDEPFGPRFRRRSCCLIYRVSPGGLSTVCGDCIIVA